MRAASEAEKKEAAALQQSKTMKSMVEEDEKKLEASAVKAGELQTKTTAAEQAKEAAEQQKASAEKTEQETEAKEAEEEGKEKGKSPMAFALNNCFQI